MARRFVYWGIQALVAFYMARDLRNRKKTRGKTGEGTGSGYEKVYVNSDLDSQIETNRITIISKNHEFDG